MTRTRVSQNAARWPALTESNLSSVSLVGKGSEREKDWNAEGELGIYHTTLKARYTTTGGIALSAGQKIYMWRVPPNRKLVTTVKASFQLISVVEDVTTPVAKSYEHMNYGMWASLKEDGEKPSDLGTGFVRNLAEDSMTADMPTEGTAVAYHGHWVANVRKAHEEGTGDIVEMEGGSKTTANFERNTITVDLMKKGSDTDKFASLTGGTISGNTFKGTAVTVVDADSGLKTTGGEYTGPGFNGAFFGPDAVEVGGVFDFTSEGKKHGELRGAFGGRKM